MTCQPRATLGSRPRWGTQLLGFSAAAVVVWLIVGFGTGPHG